MTTENRTMTVDELFAHVADVIKLYQDDDRFPGRYKYVQALAARAERCKDDHWHFAVRQLVFALLDTSASVTTEAVKAEVLSNLRRAAGV